MPHTLRPLCGLVIQHRESCSCWLNLPPFKANGLFISAVAKLAAFLKIPSRVTTYLEMFLRAGTTSTRYMDPMREVVRRTNRDARSATEQGSLRIVACDAAHRTSPEPCTGQFRFPHDSTLLQFVGRPPSVAEVEEALSPRNLDAVGVLD